MTRLGSRSFATRTSHRSRSTRSFALRAPRNLLGELLAAIGGRYRFFSNNSHLKILVQFDGIRAGLYKHCRSERGQAVSYNYRQVLGVLLSFAVKRGRVFPSLDTIARMAMCSKSTVLNAIAWLELYGFIDKLRRIVRTTGLLGPRVRQTSNAYVLSFPKGLGGLAVNVFHLAPDHNNWAPSEVKQ